MQGNNVTVLQPPVHAPVTSLNGVISEPWRQFFANLQPFLQRINQYGFQVSPVDTATRDKITPNPGQTIYNTDLNKQQLWNGTVWETVTSA